MQKSNEDCYYFLTSNCAKGPTCPYRHNPTVLTCNVICPAWSHGSCIDSNCPLRHSAVQRPTVTNAMTCYYENTPIGCRKLDCTFVHIRPRPNLRNSPNLRPSTTNLVNKDAIKPTIIPNPPISTINESVPTPQIIPTPSPVPVPKIETPPPSVPVPKVQAPPPPIPVPKVEAPSPSVPEIVPPTIKPQVEKPVIPVSSDDTKTTPTRVIVSRNVVIAEPANTSNRKVVQGTTNRIVVSSVKKPLKNDSDSDLDDLIDEENHTNHTNPLIDIPFPCSVPSITNRLFTSSTKPSTPTNDTKPIRLNRDRLPVAKSTNPHPISAPSNGEQTSAGTDLTQDDERRTNRLERFKKKPNSPPRSVVNTTPSASTRNGVNTISNERKRPAPEQITNESTPSKRLSGTIGDLCSPPSSPRRTRNRQHHHHHRRPSSPSLSRSSSSSSSSSSPSPPPLQRKSLPHQTYSTMNETAWNRQVDEFLAKTKPKSTVLPQPVPLLSLRPRYRPPSIPQQQQHQQQHPPPPLMNIRPRLRQPPPPTPSVVAQKPQAPVITPPPKPIESVPPVPVTPKLSKQQEEEDRLLELDKSADVVDTFAFIDEALFEADEFLELM